MFWHFKKSCIGFIIICAIILVTGIGVTQEVDYQQQLKEVSQQLVCLCGCGNQILYSCVCGEAKKNKALILKWLKEGKSRQEIFDIMVERQGEEVLAAPRREGINWIIWVVVPYIVPILGAIGIAFLIMRWAGRRKSIPAQDITTDTLAPDNEDSEYKKRLEQELNDFE